MKYSSLDLEDSERRGRCVQEKIDFLRGGKS